MVGAAISQMLIKPVVQSYATHTSTSLDPKRILLHSLGSSSSIFRASAFTSSPHIPSISIKQSQGFILGPGKRPGNLRILAAVKEHSGSILGAENFRFAVVVGRFNEIITKPLLTGALETFQKFAVKDEHVDVLWVPGSFEIPIAAQTLANTGKYHAIVCIGAVVRGATTHYEAVANSAASGVLSAGLNSGVPCIFGVLTCDTMEQAIDRAGGKAGNKGGEAALTAIEMASLLQKISADKNIRI